MLQLFQNPTIAWFAVGLILLLAELMLPGLILIFFGVGAWITALACLLLDISFNAQLVVFISVSILNLLFLRKLLVKKWWNKKNTGSEISDEFVGQTCLVVENIIPGPTGGKVSFRGTTWNAKANVPIASGVPVKIISKDSIILFVEPINA